MPPKNLQSATVSYFSRSFFGIVLNPAIIIAPFPHNSTIARINKNKPRKVVIKSAVISEALIFKFYFRFVRMSIRILSGVSAEEKISCATVEGAMFRFVI